VTLGDFRWLAASCAGSGSPGPLRSVTSTRTVPAQAVVVTMTVSPGRPELLCRTLLPKSSREQDSIIPARVPRAEHRAHERADKPRPVPSPDDPHALPNFRPSHQRTCFPIRAETPQDRADACKCTLTSAAGVKPNMRPAALTAEIDQARSPHPAHTAG
jgi:hypothetical protein